MDVAKLLVEARRRTAISRTELAARAGTSPSALSAYERGVKSPTVSTLNRLLAACDLQIRAVLEPYLADLDASVDALVAGTPRVPCGVARLAAALDGGGVTWAFDADTALALHGLAAAPVLAQIVVLGDEELRQLFAQLGVDALGQDGELLWRSWLDDRLDVARVGPVDAYTRIGAFRARVTADLPEPLRIEAEGRAVPVLPLIEVEQAHPQLADVLARLRHRRTVAA